MRSVLTFLLLGISVGLFANNPTINIYLFPGQASDFRIFQKLEWPENYHPICLDYPQPYPHETLKSFAYSLIPYIDTTQPYVLMGHSLGGMICAELADTLNPEKVILISSAKCRDELPFQYRFQRVVPINYFISGKVMKRSTFLVQPIFEPDRRKEKELFNAMISNKTPGYYKWTVNMIIHWDKESYHPDIVHIHGNNDHTIPLKNVKPNYVVKQGSHLMVLTLPNKINQILKKELP